MHKLEIKHTPHSGGRKRKKSIIIGIIILLAISLSSIIYYKKEMVLGLLNNNQLIKSDPLKPEDVQEESDNITPKETPKNETLEREKKADVRHEPSPLNPLLPLKTTNTIDYRNYLLSVNFLVMNFLQDKDYMKEIKQIERMELPPNIKNILEDLRQYNTDYLINPESLEIRIFPKNFSWVDKFIKIEKKI